MKIWLDTSNCEFVNEINVLGILDGVTTNPTILAASQVHPQELIQTLLKVQPGPIAVQVHAESYFDMAHEAIMLASISPRIIVKIPVTQNGIRTLRILQQKGITTLATAIFDPIQALLAFKAGANYLAPYLGRIADNGQNPFLVLKQIIEMKRQYQFEGKILAAGIRELSMAFECLKMGVCAITLSEKVFSQFIKDHTATLGALKQFAIDWSASPFVEEWLDESKFLDLEASPIQNLNTKTRRLRDTKKKNIESK